ncbi:hypothetical protein [Streptomyces globisporus]|uniref:hypothetical protein n=2 Tax=Streptomyces globisporus TaxID=1908 RepID=UPI0037945A17
MEQQQRRVRTGFRRIDRATRWAGILLCWAHATAMTLTAAEAVRDTTTDWWAVSWALTATLFIAWALLRAAQKKLSRTSACKEDEESGPCWPEDPPQYDRAA